MYKAPSMPDRTPDVVKTRSPPRRSSARLRTLSRRVLLIFKLMEPLRAMLARRPPSILPPLEPAEMLEVSMIRSLACDLAGGRISRMRPFRTPHHSASMAALVGGGTRPRPGEVALAHLDVLFLDELPEFNPQVLDALRASRSKAARR